MTYQARTIPLRLDLLDLVDDVCAALVLQQLCYWTSRCNDVDGWVYKSCDELSGETLGKVTRATVARRLKDLEAAGLVSARQGRGRTKEYRVDLTCPAVRNAVIVSAPHGWSIAQIEQSIAQNEQCIAQNEQSIAQNEQCIAQIEQSARGPISPRATESTHRVPESTPEMSQRVARAPEATSPPGPLAPPVYDSGGDRGAFFDALTVWVGRLLDSYALPHRADFDAAAIVQRLAGSELPPDDYSRYLLDDIATKAGRVQDGTLEARQVARFLATTRDISAWKVRRQVPPEVRARSPTGPRPGHVDSGIFTSLFTE